MTGLYALYLVERFWFVSNFSRHDEAHSAYDLKRGAAFSLFTMTMARPVTRPEVWSSLCMSKLEHKLVAGADMVVYQEDHKTAASYRTLVLHFPAYATTILSMYAKNIRPKLRKLGWGKASTDAVWPQERHRIENSHY